jgi:hypothetical protein
MKSQESNIIETLCYLTDGKLIASTISIYVFHAIEQSSVGSFKRYTTGVSFQLCAWPKT